MRQKLHKAGVKMDDATEVPGWKRFFAYDPFGNKLEFLEIL
jgi:hypothetical protein